MTAIELKDGVPDHLQMRDYFAAHAIIGIMSGPVDSVISNKARNDSKEAAEWAYWVADSMMIEREKSKDAAMRTT